MGRRTAGQHVALLKLGGRVTVYWVLAARMQQVPAPASAASAGGQGVKQGSMQSQCHMELCASRLVMWAGCEDTGTYLATVLTVLGRVETLTGGGGGRPSLMAGCTIP
jgi:hypothetical protein